MDTNRLCPSCQKPLAPNLPMGLCPECLIKAGFPTGAETDTGSATPRTFVPPAVEEIAKLFPQLEILELIGKGGMGAVYKARQKQLNRLVALKILPPGTGSEPAFAERFTREARALAQLNHPGIVTLYEFGETSGQFYFLMEFVDGVNLRQLLAGSRVSAREALAIVPQICDALQFAHDQGIVHRDIKPENILLDRRGRVKVADFGLAKIMEPERGRLGRSNVTSSDDVKQTGTPVTGGVATSGTGAFRDLTESGKIMGTPQYMSPEQITAPGEVDHRADIYALGVVFYQMLTGELPGKKITPPSAKMQIDVRLDEVVLRALEKKPELRYQQVSEVKTMVETIVATPPGSSRREEAQTQKTNIENPESRPKPHFSRTAIVGACLWILSVMIFAFAGIISQLATRPWLLASSVLAVVGLLCAFGFTLLGWVAVSQIRHSAGKLYGLWLAVVDGLLFPLLVVDGAIVGLVLVGLWILDQELKRSVAPPVGIPILLLAPVGLGVIALVDFLIVRVVWRAVSQPITNPVPSVQTPDRFWRRFALAVFALIAIPFLIAIVGLLAAIAIPNFVKARARAQENARHAVQMSPTAPHPEPAAIREVNDAPFVARLPAGGSFEFLAVRIYPPTNQPWWQPDGSQSKYDASIEDEAKEQVGHGIMALARIKLPTIRQTWPLPAGGKNPPGIDWANGPGFATKNGRRLLEPDGPDTMSGLTMLGVMDFKEPMAGANATTLPVKVATAEWQTLMTQKPGWFMSLFAGAARKEWKFSETPVGALKVTITHLVESADMEYRLIAVDLDGTQYLPSMTQRTKRADEHSATLEATFVPPTGSSDQWQLLLNRVREVRLEARPYEQIEFRNVSLQPGHKTTVVVKDFGGAIESWPQPQNLSYGPATECTLPMDKDGLTPLFDLDHNQPVPDPQPNDTAAGMAQLLKPGVVIRHDESAHKIVALGISGTVVYWTRAALGDQWENLTDTEALATVQRNVMTPGGFLSIDSPDTLPQAVFFKTGDGKLGILQITGFTENPRGVKIRYKLVQDPNRAKLNQPSAFTPPAGPVELESKWPPGKRYVMDLDLKQNMAFLLQGRSDTVKEDITMRNQFGLTVLPETPDGGHELELEFLSARMGIKMGDNPILDYNSTNQLAQGQTNGVAAVFGKIVGSKIRYFLNASNDAERLEGVPELVQQIQSVPQTDPLTSNLKNIFNATFFERFTNASHILPRQAVQPGDTWPAHSENAVTNVGIEVSDYKVVFQSWEMHENRHCARLEFQGIMKVKSDPNSKRDETIYHPREGVSEGVAWFDPELGQIVEIDMKNDVNVDKAPRNPSGIPDAAGQMQPITTQRHEVSTIKLER